MPARWEKVPDSKTRMVTRKLERANDALKLSGFAVPALVFIAALHGAAGLLTDLFNEKRRLTLGTGLINRSIPERKLTLRITAARIKISPFFRSFLH